MMYLSKLCLNPRSRVVQNDLSDRHQLHRTVLSGFPAVMPEGERVLYRLEMGRAGDVTLLVQSRAEPDWSRSERLALPHVLAYHGEPNPWVKAFEPSYQEGQRLRFRLHANPSVKRDGKRHALLKEAERMAWLERKGADHGFRVLAAQAGGDERAFGRKEGHAMTWQGTRFEGVLEVIDVAAFAQAVESGIGSAKGFGFGLLSVAAFAG